MLEIFLFVFLEISIFQFRVFYKSLFGIYAADTW